MRHQSLRTKPLHEQVIVITGATSGIGLATSKMAAEKGARVVLSSRNEEELSRIVSKFKAQGYSVVGIPADVSRYEDLENLKDRAVKAFGGVDTWVNNAGVSIYGYLMESPLEEEKQLMETNFWGVRHGSRVAVPELAKRGGVLINVGSEVSGHAIPLQGIYSASKHAVKAYTDALRLELEKAGLPVAVSLIRPAGIDTPFTQHAASHLHSGAPSLPAPVYHPDVVAEAILSCAVNPRRDVYIGAPARLFTVMDALMPGLADSVAKFLMFRGQTQGSKLPHQKRNEALMKAPRREGMIRGGHKGRVRRSSLYTKSNLNPWWTMAFAGLAIGAVAWSRGLGMPEKTEESPERSAA